MTERKIRLKRKSVLIYTAKKENKQMKAKAPVYLSVEDFIEHVNSKAA